MLAVIPAGGQATRFGGLFKELLPIGKDTTLLLNALATAKRLGADRYLVISTREKFQLHRRYLDNQAAEYQAVVEFAEDPECSLWCAIRYAALRCADAQNVFVMPDTVFGVPQGITLTHREFNLGLFLTREPGRFGVLSDGRIRDKDPELQGVWPAWGTITWSRAVAAWWLLREHQGVRYADHTAAFQDAMDYFGFGTFNLDYYEDLGDWEHYSAFVRTVK